MATYYVDPVSGNDASAGTSFATRWQTLTTGATAARIAPGDTIRIIASPDATSMGQNATWTDGSQTVTLTSAVTADITQATSVWTALTNVNVTTSTNRKIGSASSSIAPQAAFTTGLAAYYPLGSTVDFSAYQQISFWINMTVGSMSADGDIQIKLCSDTAGVTAVNTFNVPRILITSRWQCFTIDNAAALGSGIQSIALYVVNDRGAQTFLLNNILACKASSSSDSLSLTSLISKNTGTEQWIGLQSISGTSLVIDNNPQYNLSVAQAPAGYSGATATQTIYKREPILLPNTFQTSNNLAWGTVTDTGSAGSPITYSGGWNRTDMSTQTGDTYISGVNCGAVGLYMTPAFNLSYITIDKLNFNKFQAGYIISAGNGSPSNISNIIITAKDINSNTTGISTSNVTAGSYYLGNITITVSNINGNTTAGYVGSYITSNISSSVFSNTTTITNINSNYTTGMSLGTSGYGTTFNITNANRNVNSAGGAISIQATTGNPVGAIVNIVNSNYNYFALNLSNASAGQTIDNIFNITGSLSFNTTAINASNSSVYRNIINLNGATISTNTTDLATSFGVVGLIINGGIFDSSGINAVTNGLFDVTLNNPTGTSIVTASGISTSPSQSKLTVAGINGNNADNRIYGSGYFGSILTDTTTRHTASGVSWKMTSANGTIWGPTSVQPLSLPVATIACNSSALVTASVWVYRTSTSLTTKFVCPGGQILGVATDVSVSASAAINTWEQLTITFTPTQQGVVRLFVQCYGAAASVYVDDFSVSQA